MHYIDHAATTPVDPAVQSCIVEAMHEYGNPSSVYEIGRRQKHRLLQMKQTIKQLLHADQSDEIIFTSSGSEGNNLVIQSFIHDYFKQECHFITSAIEHASVLKTMRFAEQLGCEVTYLPVDEKGVISVEELASKIKSTTRLISIMMINNETGVRQPIETIVDIARAKGIPVHTDAVQACGHDELYVDQLLVDYLTISGHKLNAPKGIGLLYKRANSRLQATIIGGGQENGYRAGTENVPYIHGLTKALQIQFEQQEAINRHFEKLGRYLFDQLKQHDIQFEVNGTQEQHAAHIWNLWLNNIPSSQALIQCDLAQVAVSAGSACSAGSVELSPVLLAMYGADHPRVKESVRLSFGASSTIEDIDAFVRAILPLAKKLQTK